MPELPSPEELHPLDDDEDTGCAVTAVALIALMLLIGVALRFLLPLLFP